MFNINKVLSKLRNEKYNKIFLFIHDCFFYFKKNIFHLMQILFARELDKKKVIASSYYGEKYDDNTKYIVEKLHSLRPDLKIVWVKSKQKEYDLPDWISVVNTDSLNFLSKYYEYITSKVWIDTHHIDVGIVKSDNQLFIETWHGGLGIKKIELDMPQVERIQVRKILNTSKNADYFISNSKHLTDIYRRAFKYQGEILKVGYPKNDCFLSNFESSRKKVREYYKLNENQKLVLYAPTFRDSQRKSFNYNHDIYSIDSKGICELLNKSQSGDWLLLKRMHPFWNNKNSVAMNEYEIDATSYSCMQELIMACDLFISDYSSCIFDAALAGIPSFILATDYNEFAKDRDTYYKLDELPFPIAMSNNELLENIYNYDSVYYFKRWNEFKNRTELFEKGHASDSVAKVIIDFINNN